MEKTVKFTWTELSKWAALIALIISLFIANQIDIAYLKKSDADKAKKIETLENDNKKLGESIAEINGKLDGIKDNVDTIKDNIIGSVFDAHNVCKDN